MLRLHTRDACEAPLLARLPLELVRLLSRQRHRRPRKFARLRSRVLRRSGFWLMCLMEPSSRGNPRKPKTTITTWPRDPCSLTGFDFARPVTQKHNPLNPSCTPSPPGGGEDDLIETKYLATQWPDRWRLKNPALPGPRIRSFWNPSSGSNIPHTPPSPPLNSPLPAVVDVGSFGV